MPSARAALLTLGVFVLLLAVVLIQRPAGEASSVPTPQASLLSIAAEDLVQVTVRGSEATLALVKDASGNWNIESPVQSPGDQDRIAGLLSALVGIRITRTLPPDAEPASYGLDQPEFTVQLRAQGQDEEATIEVGAHNPDETKRYVRLRGETGIHLVYGYQLDQLQRMAADPPVAPTPTVPSETPTGSNE